MRTSLFRQACKALAALTTLALLGGEAVSVRAQEAKPVRLIVPTQPGSQADAVARALSQPLGKQLGQSVVVENIAGAAACRAPSRSSGRPKTGRRLA